MFRLRVSVLCLRSLGLYVYSVILTGEMSYMSVTVANFRKSN